MNNQEDGTRLVGQCEISHPVRAPHAEPTISITDDFDEPRNLGYDDDQEADEDEDSDEGTISNGTKRRRNVFFEASAKNGGYEKLGARITRESTPVRRVSRVNISARLVLYQHIRY